MKCICNCYVCICDVYVIYFFSFCYNKMSDACTQPVSAVKNSLSEKPRFLLVENDFRDQDVSMRCTHFYWSAISSCTFWQRELGTMCMCINTHITCVHTHKHYILTVPMK